MSTATDDLVVEFTEESAEEPCQWRGEPCPKVGVWAGIVTDMPCPHNRKTFCEPHKVEMAFSAAEAHLLTCTECNAFGTAGALVWERP